MMRKSRCRPPPLRYPRGRSIGKPLRSGGARGNAAILFRGLPLTAVRIGFTQRRARGVMQQIWDSRGKACIFPPPSPNPSVDVGGIRFVPLAGGWMNKFTLRVY